MLRLRYSVARAAFGAKGGLAAMILCASLLADYAVIRSLGVEFRMGCRIGDQFALDDLLQRCDAVVFATGTQAPDRPWVFNVKATSKGIAVEANTFASSSSGVFVELPDPSSTTARPGPIAAASSRAWRVSSATSLRVG